MRSHFNTADAGGEKRETNRASRAKEVSFPLLLSTHARRKKDPVWLFLFPSALAEARTSDLVSVSPPPFPLFARQA